MQQACFNFCSIFYAAFKFFPCTLLKNTWSQNFVIVMIYSLHGISIVPRERLHVQQMFVIRYKMDILAILNEFLIEKKISEQVLN